MQLWINPTMFISPFQDDRHPVMHWSHELVCLAGGDGEGLDLLPLHVAPHVIETREGERFLIDQGEAVRDFLHRLALPHATPLVERIDWHEAALCPERFPE